MSRFGSRSDPNGIQERMFCQFKHLIESMQSINTVEHAKADAPSIIFSTDA